MEPNLAGGLAGGVLIGAAAVALLVLNGRIAGVSGIVGACSRAIRTARVAGAPPSSPASSPAPAASRSRGPLPLDMAAGGPWIVVAGLLVGFGTRLGSGCTSGHGVCGLAHRSLRSLVATLTFMAVAVLTVFVIRHLLP